LGDGVDGDEEENAEKQNGLGGGDSQYHKDEDHNQMDVEFVFETFA